MELLRTTRTAESLPLHGEIDPLDVDIFRDVDAAIASGVTTVDLSGVSSMDSTGLHVLASIRSFPERTGTARAAPPSRSVARLLGIALPGAMRGVVIHPD